MKNINLLKDDIFKLFWKIALPSSIGTIFQNLFEIFRTCPSASERFRTDPNASEPVRMDPNRSEQVRASPKTSKTWENRKHFANISRQFSRRLDLERVVAGA